MEDDGCFRIGSTSNFFKEISVKQVFGDLTNLKAGMVDRVQALYNLAVPRDQMATAELMHEMLTISEQLGREIAVYLGRQGRVRAVSVGDDATVDLPDVKSHRTVRLAGIRCLHTHPGGDTTLSGPDLASLRRLRFDAMAALSFGEEGAIHASLGFFSGRLREDGTPELTTMGPLPEKQFLQIQRTELLGRIERSLAQQLATKPTGAEQEKAILAGLVTDTGMEHAEASLEKLKPLAETAGAQVVASFVQKKDKPDAAFFLGRGKVQELVLSVQSLGVSLLLLDDEITLSQQRSLELALGIKVSVVQMNASLSCWIYPSNTRGLCALHSLVRSVFVNIWRQDRLSRLFVMVKTMMVLVLVTMNE